MSLLRIFLVSFGLLFLQGASAQMFLQMEITNSVKTKKFRIGDKLVYKTNQFPDEWQSAKITSLDYETNIVRLDGKLEFVNDITHIKIKKNVPFYLSRLLYVFSATSALFGGIGDLSRGELMQQTIIFPVGSLGLAIFLDKVVSTKVYPMGKRAHLRILDLRI